MKVVISGYGKMGRTVEKVLQEKGMECSGITEDVQRFDPEIASESVCIDFTSPDAFRNNYRFLADHFKAVVVGTTGWNDIAEEVTAYFERKSTPMIYASNFSIGVNIYFKVVETMSRLIHELGEYGADITEVHHIHKLDKPSGTAKTIATIVGGVTGVFPAIESIREGEVAGTHILNFRSRVDEISLAHKAFSREGFALGAVQAAVWTEEIDGVKEFRTLLNNKFMEILK